MKLYDLLNPTDLARELHEGYVKYQTHPDFPQLHILNYTDKATWEKHWNPVTRKCRGLIYDANTEEVLARPFEKFFNYGEIENLTELVDAEDTGLLDMDAKVETTDKMDGSLGILYPLPTSQWARAIATRGSFASEQALWATKFLREQYPEFRGTSGWTTLFEIIYPENRIVVDYKDMQDLVLLGHMNIETGRTVGPTHGIGWPGPRAATFKADTLAQALLLPPRPNAEGVVVHYLSGKAKGERIKIKQADYVQLHRLITGMNARVVWERMGAGEAAVDICKGVPEEFHQWIMNIAKELLAEQMELFRAATDSHSGILDKMCCWGSRVADRKEYASYAVKSPHKAWLFMLLDGKDILPAIWKTLKPSGERKLKYLSEDTA
jgi:RNA ligase